MKQFVFELDEESISKDGCCAADVLIFKRNSKGEISVQELRDSVKISEEFRCDRYQNGNLHKMIHSIVTKAVEKNAKFISSSRWYPFNDGYGLPMYEEIYDHIYIQVKRTGKRIKLLLFCAGENTKSRCYSITGYKKIESFLQFLGFEKVKLSR